MIKLPILIICSFIISSFYYEAELSATHLPLNPVNNGLAKVEGTILLPKKATRTVKRKRRSRRYKRGTIALSKKARKYTPYEKSMIYLIPLDKSNNKFVPKQSFLYQENVSFQPAHIVVQKGNDVLAVNKDNIFHNVFSNTKNSRFNIGKQRKDKVIPIKLNKTGHIQVFCDIHAFMSAIISVIDTPYYTTVNPDKSFTIENVPPGKYRLVGWHNRAEFKGAVIELRANRLTKLNKTIRFQ